MYKHIVEGEVWRQDYEMQTLVYPGSQNIEAQAWMVKTMSAGCVNTVVALITSDCISCSEKIDPPTDQKQEINFVWPNVLDC